MKKIWSNAEVVELSISGTQEIESEKKAVDYYQDGWYKEGVNEGSGKPGNLDDYTGRS